MVILVVTLDRNSQISRHRVECWQTFGGDDFFGGGPIGVLVTEWVILEKLMSSLSDFAGSGNPGEIFLPDCQVQA